jgi:hypothetical protein
MLMLTPRDPLRMSPQSFDPFKGSAPRERPR